MTRYWVQPVSLDKLGTFESQPGARLHSLVPVGTDGSALLVWEAVKRGAVEQPAAGGGQGAGVATGGVDEAVTSAAKRLGAAGGRARAAALRA